MSIRAIIHTSATAETRAYAAAREKKAPSCHWGDSLTSFHQPRRAATEEYEEEEEAVAEAAAAKEEASSLISPPFSLSLSLSAWGMGGFGQFGLRCARNKTEAGGPRRQCVFWACALGAYRVGSSGTHQAVGCVSGLGLVGTSTRR